jgi:hypothetical protein
MKKAKIIFRFDHTTIPKEKMSFAQMAHAIGEFRRCSGRMPDKILMPFDIYCEFKYLFPVQFQAPRVVTFHGIEVDYYE